jgi:hypothetical protein
MYICKYSPIHGRAAYAYISPTQSMMLPTHTVKPGHYGQAITLNPGGRAGGCADTKSGMHCVSGTYRSRDASSKGCIVQETHRPRVASSKSRIVQGSHRPRVASYKGRIVQGTHWDESSSGRIVQETHRPRDASSKNKCLEKHRSGRD